MALKPLEYFRARMNLGKTKVTEAPIRDPKKVAVKKLGQVIKGSGSGDFEDNPVDLAEVQRAYYTDSYIRRAIDKYSGLMFKNGWELQGKNQAAIDYVNTRLKLMAEATETSIDSILATLAADYVLFGNAYLVKARQKGAMATGVKAVGYTNNQPIAGYFVLAASTITISRDEVGKILSYQQTTASGTNIEYKPTEVIHIAYRKPSTRAYGVPFIFNALDDVKILRQIEENVARLIYRNLFPLYMYQVGSEKPGFEATDEEIEAVREEIRNMPMDGGIVVPERHNIKVVGSNGQAIDANGYLAYFRQRVFTGLGVSDTVMGVGGTANRSTSDNQAADLFDMVKDFQRGFAEAIKMSIIYELLFEGGYDPTINKDDEINFFFHEIELDSKIKKENHAVQLFTQNAITHDEMRLLMGLDPVADESRLYFNLVTIPTAQQSAAATATDAQATATQQATAANNAGQNKNQPANQNGSKPSPGKPKASLESFEENFSNKVLTEAEKVVTLVQELEVQKYTQSLEAYWNQALDDVIARVRRHEDVNQIKGLTTRLIKGMMDSKSKQYLEQAISLGFRSGREKVGIHSLALHQNDVKEAVQKGKQSIDKVIEELEMSLDKLTTVADEKRIAYVESAFHANKYRLKMISNTMLYSSYNMGFALAAVAAKQDKLLVHSTETACAVCQAKPGEIKLDSNWRDSIPPHHPNCNCELTLAVPEEGH
jgi:hypothetical protein